MSRLLSILHRNVGGTTLDGATYTYDNAGNRLTRTDQQTGTQLSYTYDNIYQLLTAMQGSTTLESYTYDLVGNRLSSLGVSPYQYNSSNQLTSIAGGGTYAYDNNGSLTSKPDGTTYTWDYENRLTKVTLPGVGGTVTFKYDPMGRRIQKAFTQGSTTTTTNYVYDGMTLLEELDNSGNALARYTASNDMDEPLSQLRGTTISYYQQDAISSVTSLSDPAAALASTYTYDSFGKLIASTGTLANPFQYTGREFDQETGIYSYRARYFDQNIGRFVSEDPVRFRAGVNFYSYVGNNPALLSDPLGLDPKGSGWWQSIKDLARACWRDPFACGGQPGTFGVGKSPFNLCNAGDVSLFYRTAPNNPYTKGTESNSEWLSQFHRDCTARSTPGKSTYVMCSQSSISYGGTSYFCHCCQTCEDKGK